MSPKKLEVETLESADERIARTGRTDLGLDDLVLRISMVFSCFFLGFSRIFLGLVCGSKRKPSRDHKGNLHFYRWGVEVSAPF